MRYTAEAPIMDHVRGSTPDLEKRGIRQCKFFLCRKINIRRIAVFWGNIIP